VRLSLLKNHFLLLTFFVVCKFFVFFHSQRWKWGGHGFRVNKYNLFIRLITSPYWALHSLRGYQENY
jgi:hypothetical protein